MKPHHSFVNTLYCHNCDLARNGLNLIVKDEGIEIECLKFIFRFGNGPTT